jgi:hypothetical protein
MAIFAGICTYIDPTDEVVLKERKAKLEKLIIFKKKHNTECKFKFFYKKFMISTNEILI